MNDQKTLDEVVKIIKNLELTVEPQNYPSKEERHLIKVTEAGVKGAILDKINDLRHR